VSAGQELAIAVVPFDTIDREATAALINLAFHRHPIMGGDRTSAAQLEEEAGKAAEFIEVRRGGKLIGTAMIRPAADVYGADELPIAPDLLARSLYFGLAAVDSLEVSAGIGKRLVAEAERIASERGYAQVLLGTLREFGLVEYYARLGYIVMAQQDFPAGHWSVLVPHRHCEMVKAL
jgi:predicted N-acetyltransferase YhbS